MSKCKEVIIDSIEKTIDSSMMNRYLIQTKNITKLQQFSKNKQYFILSFDSHEEAKVFLMENAFTLKIMKRTFNIYYSSFLDIQNKRGYQLSGINEANIRNVFEICAKHNQCRFKVHYEKQKLYMRCKVYFVDSEQLICQKQQSLKWVQKQLLHLNVSMRLMEPEEIKNQFFCSIEYNNFAFIENIQISAAIKEQLTNQIRYTMAKLIDQDIKKIQIKTYIHKGTIPSVKAYITYETPQITISAFESLRMSIINLKPQIQAKLFYFHHQANTFRTLFTKNLIKPQHLTQKQFQNQLLINFRQINAKITQILIKEVIGHTWTGKIYLADEESGKNFIIQYVKNRKYIFEFYKDKNNIYINLFQSLDSMNKIKKVQDSADRMLKHFKHTKQVEKIMTPKPLPEFNQRQYINNGYRGKNNAYKKYYNEDRPQQYRQHNKQSKYRQLQKNQTKTNKKVEQKQHKVLYHLKQQDFPSME